MIPRNEALELIEGIERAARRTRPLIMFGLIAIVAGFVFLSVYLYQDLRTQKARADALDREAGELRATLSQAQDLARAPAADLDARRRLQRLLRVAAGQIDSLEVAVETAQPAEQTASLPEKTAPSPPPAPVAPTVLPVAPQVREEDVPDTIRLVIHIADPTQRGAVAQLRLGLSRLGERTLQTEVREVPRGQDNSLRCLRPAECLLLNDLAALVNRRLRSPVIRNRDFTGYHLNLRNIPQGTYELWFRPGPIELRLLDDPGPSAQPAGT